MQIHIISHKREGGKGDTSYDDYLDFKYCDGLPYPEGLHMKVYCGGVKTQDEAIQRVLTMRGKTVYVTALRYGAIFADNGNIKLPGDVRVFEVK